MSDITNPYSNLAEFNAYKDKISEHIHTEITKIPNYLSQLQKDLSGLSHKPLPPNVRQPVYFEDYDVNADGVLDEKDVIAWVDQHNRLDVSLKLELIINGEAPFPPIHPQSEFKYMQRDGGWFQKTLKEGKIFTGRETNEILVAYDDEFSSQTEDVHIIDYIAYKLGGNNPSYLEVELLQNTGDYAWLPFSMPYVKINNGPGGKVIVAPDAFKRIFTESFDNDTGAYASPEIQAWATNQMTGETQHPNEALSQLEGILKSQNFKPFQSDEYKLWDNTSQFLPIGIQKRPIARPILEDLENTEVTELLPGDLQEKIDRFFDSWNNLKEFIDVGWRTADGVNMLTDGDFGGGIGPGAFVGSIDAEGNDISGVTQDIIVKENPGFSPYVLRTSGNTDHFYSIKVGANHTTGVILPADIITLSCWTCKDDTYTGDLLLFATQYEYVYEDGTSDFIYRDSQYEDLIQNGNLEGEWTGNADGNEWKRYKKTITIPAIPDSGKPLDHVVMVWKLNRIPDNLTSFRNTDNNTFRYFTGLRIDGGNEVNDTSYINLKENNPKTLFQIARDIQNLTLEGKVPIFSSTNLDNFMDAQKISGIVTELLILIRDNLTKLLEDFALQTNTTVTKLTTSMEAIIEAGTFVEGQPIEEMTTAIGQLQQAIISTDFDVGDDAPDGFADWNIFEQLSWLADNAGNYAVTGGFVASIRELRDRVDNIKLWVTSLDFTGAQVVVDENQDGYDDSSYNAGYQNGVQAGYEQAYQEWSGMDVATSTLDIDLELFDLNNDGIINYEELAIIDDLQGFNDSLFLESSKLRNPARDDGRWEIRMNSPIGYEGSESVWDEMGLTAEYETYWQYNKQILRGIIQQILNYENSNSQTERYHPYSFENKSEVVNTKDVFALLSMRPWMMADGFQGGMRCPFNRFPEEDGPFIHGAFEVYGLVPVVLDMMKIMHDRAAALGWSEQPQLFNPGTGQTLGHRLTPEITNWMRNFNDVRFNVWHDHELYTFQQSAGDTVGPGWLWGGVIEDTWSHYGWDFENNEPAESQGLTGEGGGLFRPGDVDHVIESHAKIFSPGNNVYGQPEHWSGYHSHDPTNLFFLRATQWPGLETPNDYLPDGNAFVDPQPPTYGMDYWHFPNHPNLDLDNGDWERPNHPYSLNARLTGDNDDFGGDQRQGYDASNNFVYVTFRDILAAMYLYNSHNVIKGMLRYNSPGSPQNLAGHMEWHYDAPASHLGKGLPMLVIEEMILNYAHNYLIEGSQFTQNFGGQPLTFWMEDFFYEYTETEGGTGGPRDGMEITWDNTSNRWGPEEDKGEDENIGQF